MPKSDTFTSLFFEMRQFRAACMTDAEQNFCNRLHNKKSLIKCLYTWFYQIPVDKIGAFQVRHPFADIQTHSQQRFLRQVASLLQQVICQTPFLHVLKHQTHGRALCAHSKELHQFTVRQLPVGAHSNTNSLVLHWFYTKYVKNAPHLHHNFCLLFELVIGHALFSHHLHRHLRLPPPPLQYKPKLPAAYLLPQDQLLREDVPLICWDQQIPKSWS